MQTPTSRSRRNYHYQYPSSTNKIHQSPTSIAVDFHSPTKFTTASSKSGPLSSLSLKKKVSTLVLFIPFLFVSITALYFTFSLTKQSKGKPKPIQHLNSAYTHTSVSLIEPKLFILRPYSVSSQPIHQQQPQLSHNSQRTVSSTEHQPTNQLSSIKTILDEENDPTLLLPVNQRKDIHGNSIYNSSHINNPTKIKCLEHRGCPPRQLPKSHSQSKLLRQIRRCTSIHPRWPYHPSAYTEKLRSYGPAFSSVIVSHKLKAVYFPVFKAGTTTMMWHIAYLENNKQIMETSFKSKDDLDILLHDMSHEVWKNHTIFNKDSEQIRQILDDPTYLKFGFVRNPFDRLVSAYVDKIINFSFDDSEYQLQMYGLYGDNLLLRKTANITKPTFEEFIYRISLVIQSPRVETDDLWKPKAYEDNKTRRDVHWRPQVELLHPDLVHLDFVGRFENMNEDLRIIFSWMYQHTNRRMNPTDKKKMHTTQYNIKKPFFEILRKKPYLKQLVLEMYKQDFETFGFDTNIP